MICLMLLLAAAGCTALDEGYSTHYGLTSTEYPRGRPNPAEETYGGGKVGIQEIEEYEEKYREKDVMEREAPADAAEE